MFSKKRIRTLYKQSEQKKLLEQQKKAKVSSEQNVINSIEDSKRCSFNNKITEKNKFLTEDSKRCTFRN